MTKAYLIDSVRTPRSAGKRDRRALAYLHPQRLAGPILKAVAERGCPNTAAIINEQGEGQPQ